MYKLIITTIVLLTAITATNGQDLYQIREALDFFRTNKLHSGDWKQTLTESDIEGSPYLNDEFVSGSVYTISKQQFVDIPLRYNIFNDQVEFKTPQDEVMALAAPEIIEKIDFGDYTMAYAPYSNVKKVRKGFFRIELTGKASLYTKHEVIFKEAEPPAAYKDPVPAKFVKKPDIHYIKIGMAEAKKVGNKNELIEIFPDNEQEITTFIKKNKIKSNKVEDLKKLVEYYNSL